MIYGNHLFAKEAHSLDLIVDNIQQVEPTIEADCEKEKEKETEKEVDQTVVVPKTMFGFVKTSDSEKPYRFYIYSKTGMRTFGRPNKFLLEPSRSDLRLMDRTIRDYSSDAKKLDSLSSAEFKDFLDNKTTYSEEEKQDLAIIRELSSLSSEKEILDTLRERASGFSYERKLHLLASIGSNFSSGYDRSRNNQSLEASEGFVSTVDLFKAIRDSVKTGTIIDAGVCRDMHMSMAKMAKAIGLNNAYGVSYQTRSNAHLILTTTPNSYGQVSTVNYSSVQTTDDHSGTGTLELDRGGTLWGQRIDISEGTSNKMVLRLPTRLGQAISRASGADDESLVFGEYNLSKGVNVGVQTNFGNIIFDNQRDLQGSDMEVSGVYYQIDKSPFSFLRFNGAVGYFDSTRALGTSKALESGLYLRTSTSLGDQISLGNNWKVTGFINHGYDYTNSCRRTSDNPHCVEDDPTIDEQERVRPHTYNLNFLAGAGIHYDSSNLHLSSGYKARLQLVDDDIRVGSGSKSLRASQHQLYLDYSQRIKEFDLSAYGRLNFTDLEDQIVKTYQAGGQVTYRPFGLSVLGETRGRIESSGQVAPAWLPGTENAQLYRMTKDFDFGKSHVGIEYQMSDDFPELNTGFVIFRTGN